MKRLLVALACSCSSGPATPAARPSNAPGEPPGSSCVAMRGKVEQLYRSEARIREPARVDEAVADNTSMVMTDCAQAPDKVAACLGTATTVADLEARCLAPIDDEGTEGDKLTH